MCSWKFHKIHRKTPVPETFLKKRLWYRCFTVNFVKFLRTPFLQNTSERLLLNVGYWSKSISWKYFMFHEMTLKLYFMKCLERNISQCILPFKRIFNLVWIGISWSSRSQMFFKIGVLKNCAIFTEKHLCWTLFLIKMQVCRSLLLTFWAYFFQNEQETWCGVPR